MISLDPHEWILLDAVMLLARRPEAFKLSFHRSNRQKLFVFPNKVNLLNGVQRTKSFGSGVRGLKKPPAS